MADFRMKLKSQETGMIRTILLTTIKTRINAEDNRFLR